MQGFGAYSNGIKCQRSADLMLAERYGVRSVPHLVINGKHHVSGAIGLDKIIEALGKIK